MLLAMTYQVRSNLILLLTVLISAAIVCLVVIEVRQGIAHGLVALRRSVVFLTFFTLGLMLAALARLLGGR